MTSTTQSTNKPQARSPLSRGWDGVYALAIVAHPDDEAFLMAGTCLKLAAEGKNVAVVCATRGEKGQDRLKRDLQPDEMAKIRSAELQHACDIIHCHQIEFLNYPDGGLDQADFENLNRDLVDKIGEHRPEIILTFGAEGISGHKDHIVIGKAAVEAAKQSKHRVREIWLASIPASSIEKFNQHLRERKVHHSHFQNQPLQGVADDQLLKIDIRQYAQTKLQAVQAHASQYLPHFVLDIFLTEECFEVLKP